MAHSDGQTYTSVSTYVGKLAIIKRRCHRRPQKAYDNSAMFNNLTIHSLCAVTASQHKKIQVN